MGTDYRALGHSGATWTGALETIPVPKLRGGVAYSSDEVTALCPVTGQPDWYRVEILLDPDGRAIESKSLKLFLQSFREYGVFCEELAQEIASQIGRDVTPNEVTVSVEQKPRGGVTITATHRWVAGDES